MSTSELTTAADPATFRFVGQHTGVDDFVVWGFEGTERLNHPYSFQVELIPSTEDIDPMRLLGFGATLTLERRGHQRAIQGVVERVTIEHRYDPPRAVVVLVPALVASRYTTATRIFQDSTALEIVERVLTEDLGRFRRTFDSSGLERERFARRDYCVQYRESNLDFVHRLLEEEGVGYYFCAGESSETLVLFESNRSLSSVETLETGPLPFDLGTQRSGTAELIHWFSSVHGLVTGATTVRDHDWIQGRSIVESSMRSEPSAHELGERYDHGLGRGVTVYEDTVQHGALTAAAIAAALPMGMPLEITHSVIDLPGAVLPPWSGNDVDAQTRLRLDSLRRDRHTFQGGGSVCGLGADRATSASSIPEQLNREAGKRGKELSFPASPLPCSISGVYWSAPRWRAADGSGSSCTHVGSRSGRRSSSWTERAATTSSTC